MKEFGNRASEANLVPQVMELEILTTQIITEASQDTLAIELALEILLSLRMFRVCQTQFVRLIEYYKTVDQKGAARYWSEFDQEN